jgi:MFS family permease
LIEVKPDDARGSEPKHWGVISALGIAQIISWGSLYYAFSFLIEPLQAASGAGKSTVVGAFSLGLLIAGLLSVPVGAIIDRAGGRSVMTAGSLAAAALLTLLSLTDSVELMYLAWIGLGAAMAATLYDPAFAILTAMFQTNYRRAIAALTLFGGFASTVFWPLTEFLIAQMGWRDALLVLASFNLLICAPLHWWVVPARARVSTQSSSQAGTGRFKAALGTPAFYLLTLSFIGNTLVFSAVSVHLMLMLQDKGLTSAQAALVGAMVGPMQVAGRILEITAGARLAARTIGIIAMGLLPLSLAVLFAAETNTWMLLAFATLYGAGNGVMTIVRGAIAAEVFGREAYGAINGAMAAPVIVAKAAGPLVAALALTALGSYDRTLLLLIVVGAIATGVFAVATVWRR